MSCPDAVFGVFRCLEAPADLARSACVSRVWRDVVYAPLLWHALLEAEHRAAAHPDLASSRETSRSKQLQQRQARARNIWADWAGEDEGAVAGPEDLEAGELQPPVGGAEVTPGEVADLGGSGFDVLVSCAGDSGDSGACGGGVHDNQQSLPGSGFVATGHPDGRVLVWDAARAAAVGRLPSMQGCGRGPVLALAAASMCSPASGGTAEDVEEDGGVLVWSLPLPEFSPAPVAASAAASIPSDAVVGTLPSTRLEAIIKPTLDTAVRSMALSGRHGVLALRSSDGVELRSVRRAEAGRWLHGFRDRRNTALLCLGDLLFVASSSPSFMMAATSAPPPPPPAASPALGAMEAAGAAADVHVEDGETSPAQRCRLPAEEASRILWDQPLQVCATGGFLVVRCLQFDASQQQPAQVQLLWPGLFAFPMGDLVSGLQLAPRLLLNRKPPLACLFVVRGKLPPSLQLLAAPRSLVLVTPEQEVWLQPVPYTQPFPSKHSGVMAAPFGRL
eukprot:XP_001699624.1 predicted protein [Chlamydomonas reinhardtii]